MHIQSHFLLLFIGISSLVLIPASSQACNGKILVNSFSSNSTTPYLTFDATTTPALPTSLQSGSVKTLTFSFWWYYNASSSADYQTIVSVNQSTSSSNALEAYRTLIQLNPSVPEFRVIVPTSDSQNITLTNSIKITLTAGTWYWTLFTIDYAQNNASVYLYEYGKEIIYLTHETTETFDSGYNWEYTNDLKIYVGGDPTSTSSIFTVESFYIYSNLFVDNNTLSLGSFLSADTGFPIIYWVASQWTADNGSIIDAITEKTYAQYSQAYQPRINFDEGYVIDWTASVLNFVPITSPNVYQPKPHVSFTIALKFKAIYSTTLPSNCSYNVIFSRFDSTMLPLYSIGYANNQSLILQILWFTFDTGVTLEPENVWNTIAISCFPVTVSGSYYCDINGESKVFSPEKPVNYYPTSAADEIIVGDIGCAAPVKMMWFNYHYGGGGVSVDSSTSPTLCSVEGCNLTIHSNTENSTCLEKVCGSRHAYDAKYSVRDCASCQGSCEQCNDPYSCNSCGTSCTCTATQYLKADGTCGDCSTNCATCQGQSDFCTSCSDSNILSVKNYECQSTPLCIYSVNQVCKTCGGKYYADTFASTTPICTSCGINCDYCFSAEYCSHCTTSTYVTQDTECLPCDSNCKNCKDTSTHCTECYPPRILYNGMCCPEGCATCSSTTTCTSCISGYQFINETCSYGCPENHIILNGNCVCSNVDTTFCQQCPNDVGSCTECISGYFLLPNGTCGSSCPTDFFAYDKECVNTSARITDSLRAIIDSSGERLGGFILGILLIISMLII